MQIVVVFVSLLALGLCSTCVPEPKPCPKILAPVCATFTKTYNNQCLLENDLCRLAKEGFEYDDSPGQPAQQDCCDPRACPLIYDPVCGSDGNMYPNECAMKVEGCKTRDYITKDDPNNCHMSTTTQMP